MGLIPTEALMKKVSQAAFQHIFDSGLLFFDLASHTPIAAVDRLTSSGPVKKECWCFAW